MSSRTYFLKQNNNIALHHNTNSSFLLIQAPKLIINRPVHASSKETTCQCRKCKKLGFDLWVGKISGVRNGNSLPYSCQENPRNRGTWWARVHGVAKS